MAEETKKQKEASSLAKTNENSKIAEAIVNGRDLHLSTKYAAGLCGFIRGKDIDRTIMELEQVVRLKKPIPMKGEYAHQKGIMSGKFPVKGAGIFMKLLKSLKSNAIAKDMELEKFKIFCTSGKAPRPYKRFGQGRMKRCHVIIKLISRSEKKKEKK